MRGLNADDLRSIFSIPDSEVVTADEFWEVLKMIQEKMPEAMVGINAGKAMSLQALGLIYQLSMQCTTVQEAIFYLQSYINCTLPLLELQIKEETDDLVIILAPQENTSGAFFLLGDAVLTIIEKELRLMSRGKIKITCTSTHYSKDYPENWSSGQNFSLTASEIELTASLNPHLNWNLAILVPAYIKLIQNINPPKHDFVGQVKSMALNMAKPELPSLLRLAGNFNMTSRSFQRNLFLAGSNYRTIIDELNREISFCLLQHKSYKVSDIAAILGYAESSSYIRAKKRWHNILI